MRFHLTLFALSLSLTGGLAHAQAQKAVPQGDKVAMCEKAAGNKVGNDRKAFLSSCMSSTMVANKAQPSSGMMTGYMGGCEHGSKAEDL
jgi:hypothetical protein